MKIPPSSKILFYFHRLLCFGAVVASCSSCTPVKPWERGILSKPFMALEPNPLEARFRSHIAESKTGSSGGYGVGGGGCGCN